METFILILATYLVGCLFSYWRMLASFSHIMREETIWGFLRCYGCVPGFFIILSWVGFIFGIVFYIEYKDTYFFKFHVKDHRP